MVILAKKPLRPKSKEINSFRTEVPTYRNRSIDLLYKSMDWFLFDRDLRHERIKDHVCTAKIKLKNRKLKFINIYTHTFEKSERNPWLLSLKPIRHWKTH